MYAKLVRQLPLSPTLKAACFDFQDRTYLITAGFDSVVTPAGFAEIDPDGGLITAFLFETSLRPSATTVEIRQVIEVGDKRVSAYDGHDFELVQSLFSHIQTFARDALSEEDAAKTFLLLCLADRRRYDHWIDEDLAQALGRLISVSTAAIPYEILCRAVLDFDSSAMFLALYRSLEALYAREKTMALMSDLGISKSWILLAQQLESHLGWYPREEPSLEAILQSAKNTDLHAVMKALGETVPEDGSLVRAVTRKIYTLRNNLVHYRTFHQLFSAGNIDWCRLCESMTSIAIEAYAATVHPNLPAGTMDDTFSANLGLA